jgi:hypothetical protein
MQSVKSAGVATLAALTLGALSASPALASSNGEFTGEHYKAEGAKLTAVTTHLNGFKANESVSVCEKGEFRTGEEGAEANTGPSHELTIHPRFSGCKVGLQGVNYPATIKSEGCNYRFHDTTPNSTTETVDLVCSEGHKIKVELEKTVGVELCHIEVGSQNGLKDITYNDTGAGTQAKVNVEASVTGIHYESNCSGVEAKGERGEYKEGVFNKTTGLAELGPGPATAESTGTYLLEGVTEPSGIFA